MFRVVGAFSLGLFIGACAHAAPPSTSLTSAELASDAVSKTVALLTEEGNGSTRAFCAGVWVSETSILTSWHCLANYSSAKPLEYAVRSDLQEWVGGRLTSAYALDPGHDLALLRAEDVPRHAVAKVAAGTQVGAVVHTVGHPLGLWWSFSTGAVAAVRNTEISERRILWVQATAPISPGNSGGGLFDEAGQLVGLAHGTNPVGQNLNFFVHASHIEVFLSMQGFNL